jgi:hypothetical protein
MERIAASHTQENPAPVTPGAGLLFFWIGILFAVGCHALHKPRAYYARGYGNKPDA